MGEVLGAFLLGVLSAASLGLGALTARIWKPTNFVLGILTAFGAGALLSAVTIDLVATSVEAGDVGWLAVGAVGGGVAFEALNRTINARGGFLRKASTSITFLRDREQRRRRRILDRLERIDVFDGLPDRELDAIAEACRSVHLDSGEVLYRHGDPCEHLNVLAGGEISLHTAEGRVPIRHHQAFGHLAFMTGTQHRSTATAVTDAHVLRLNRSRLRSVLGACPALAERLRDRVGGDDLRAYLRANHPEIADDDIEVWTETIEREGIERLPPLVDLAVTGPPEHIVDHLGEIDPFRGVPRDLLDRIAGAMFPEEHEAGYVFFRPGDASERIYVIADGEVALVGASGGSDVTVLSDGDEFGSLSCLTGTRHSAAAIAQRTTDVWVLRRADLAELIERDPAVRRAVVSFLDSDRVNDYLVVDHDFGADAAATTRRRTIATVRRGSLPDAPRTLAGGGAPIAIWLGLLLDGVPESVVIGASADALRVSFLVGIALSNYPEALASSVGMREQGLGWRSISTLWGSVVLVTGLGAAVGSVMFQQASTEAFAVVEGLAAGAMLTVITQTMMPEALHRSGGLVGLSALAGFLFTTLVGA
ncbi:MAG: cyclic nucleotide-binding domain-containing protein [Actinomycetota bacterium]